MDIQGLGYVGIRAKSLEDWTSFGTQFLGMQLVERSGKSLALRMDDRKQRVVVSEDGGEGVAFFGWEVADVAALDRLAAKLERSGVAVARGARALADERRVKELIVLADPLGFRLSDYMRRPFNAYFFHANPRHHSIAFIETGRNATHHLMVELFSLDDVGQCYDLALGEEGRIGVTLGRHINDEVTSFYSNSPSGFMVEYGWGGRVIDVDQWQPAEVTFGPSMWGHDRLWMSPDKRAEARAIRVAAAATGLRKPVNVIEGNHNRMPGVCPWWDGVMRGEAAE